MYVQQHSQSGGAVIFGMEVVVAVEAEVFLSRHGQGLISS